MHDPVDSLIYLSRGTALDWAMDTIADRFDEGEVEDILDALEDVDHMIWKQMRLHHDGRKCYSNGVPFERVYMVPAVEPDGAGGENAVVVERYFQMDPGDPAEVPPERGGVWKS